MKRILVTGGAGYIGSHICKALAQVGHMPIVYDNLSRGFKDLVRFGPLVEGEIGNAQQLDACFKEHSIEGVIHCAALAYVGESVQNPALYYRNNVSGTLTLLEQMQAHGISNIVFSSSCTTYGEGVPSPIGEEAPQWPCNPYGWTKFLCERMIRDFGFNHALLRYFNASGADPDGEIGEMHDPETHLIPKALQVALGIEESLSIFGDDFPTPDGTAVRDYIHVTDLADAHVRALEHLVTGGESLALNLGTGRGTSVREIVGIVERVVGKKLPVRVGPRRAGDAAVLFADSRKAKEILGWKPAYSDLEAIVSTHWAWLHRANVPSATTA